MVYTTRIVVPCYNEAARLKKEAFLAALIDDPDVAFLFVDDGSKDTTVQVLESLRRDNPSRIEYFSLERNSGKAEAVRRGMLKAMEEDVKYIGYWDADLATPLETIAVFTGILASTEAELVIGSRVRLLGKDIDRRISRHYLGRIFATCASLLLQISIYDTQCGAKIFRNSASLRQVLEKAFVVNWTFDVELLARFGVVSGSLPSASNPKWIEYPLDRWSDIEGSKVKGRDFVKGAVELLTLFGYLHTPFGRSYKQSLLRDN